MNGTVLESDDVVQQLETSPADGLSSIEVKKRLEKYGINELVEKGAKSPWRILFDQFKEPMVVILLIAALVFLALGEEDDVIIILTIMVLNAVICFSQECRAEQAVVALKKLSIPHVKVRRDGRLLESIHLKIEEAALTGKSEAVEKVTKALPSDHLTLGDQKNMVFMGTVLSLMGGERPLSSILVCNPSSETAPSTFSVVVVDTIYSTFLPVILR